MFGGNAELGLLVHHNFQYNAERHPYCSVDFHSIWHYSCTFLPGKKGQQFCNMIYLEETRLWKSMHALGTMLGDWVQLIIWYIFLFAIYTHETFVRNVIQWGFICIYKQCC